MKAIDRAADFLAKLFNFFSRDYCPLHGIPLQYMLIFYEILVYIYYYCTKLLASKCLKIFRLLLTTLFPVYKLQ